MFLRKPLIKTLLVFAVYFRNFFLQIYKRYGVDVGDDVTTPKAIKCANDKIFWCFEFLSQKLTCYKTICIEYLVCVLLLTLI